MFGFQDVHISDYCTYIVVYSSDLMLECEPGMYSTGLQDSCTPCPAGQQCPHADGSLNQNCTSGHYSIGKAMMSSSCHDFIQCSLIIGRSVSCTRCPPGHYCPRTDLAEVLGCQLGTYSVGGQTSCTMCPAER